MNPTFVSSRARMAFLSVATFLLMAYIDHITGFELVFSAAYLIPVSICAWNFGVRSVLCMSVSSGIATWTTDLLSGHPYSHYMFHYWNSFTCMLISMITGLLLLRLRKSLEEKRAAYLSLKNAHEELERSTGEIRRLQQGLQTMCAWTRRIEVDGQWMEPEEFLSTRLHIQISHGISPEALAKLKQQLELEKQNKEL